MIQYEEEESTNVRELKDDTSFLKFFQSLPKEKNLVRFWWRKKEGVYSAHGEDAQLIALEYYKNTNYLKNWGKTGPTAKKLKSESPVSTTAYLEYICIRGSDHGIEFEEILQFVLFKKQCRVEIWHQPLGKMDWTIAHKGSAGNLEGIEDLLPTTSETKESSVALAVRITSTEQGNKNIGVAFIDSIKRIIQTCEFEDNERLTNFESLIIQVGAKECLCNSIDIAQSKIEAVLAVCGIPLNSRRKVDFQSRDVHQDLGRLLGEENLSQHIGELELKLAIEATEALIKYLELLSDEGNFGTFKIKRYHLKQYMRLDASVLDALNLVPTKSEMGSQMSKITNLYGLLNHCVTSMGSRRLMQWIRQPLIDVKEIVQRHTLVEVFVSDSAFRTSLQNLITVPDLDKLTKKFHQKKAKLEDCHKVRFLFHLFDPLKLYIFAKSLPALTQRFKEYHDKKYYSVVMTHFTKPLEKYANDCEGFIQMIEEAMDLKAASELPPEYIIHPSFDKSLESVYAEKKQIEKSLATHKEEVVDELDVKKDSALKCEYSRKNGWYFELPKSQFEKSVNTSAKKNKFKLLDVMRKAGYKFRDQKLEVLNNRYQEVMATYSERQSKIVNEMLEIVDTYLSVAENASEFIASLDVYLAFATRASLSNYSRPTILPENEEKLELIQARHPCLEVQDDVQFVPNDLKMVKGQSTFIILTGPNMGGKSTYLRTVGMNVLMAQIGCFVPCSAAKISIVDSIHARVGANDSLNRGVSTFMAEMLDMSSILRSATKRSLLLIDELGRGTSTYDGFGIAWSISEKICELGAYCLFATHYHELTELTKRYPCAVNFHVHAEVVDGDLVLMHQVIEGPALQSYGIDIAKIANFPDEVITVARQKAAQLEQFDDKNGETMADRMEDVVKSHPGEQLIEKFLEEFVKLPLDKFSPEEGFNKIQQLKRKLNIDENPYVAQLIS